MIDDGEDPDAYLDGLIATGQPGPRRASRHAGRHGRPAHVPGQRPQPMARRRRLRARSRRRRSRELNVDRFLLEYESERAGGFEPLRFVPRDKMVVLGLISSKLPQLEQVDQIRRRIDEASKYIPVENLAVSTQCGFASTQQGNLLTWDEQKRKLELVAEVARQAFQLRNWGAKERRGVSNGEGIGTRTLWHLRAGHAEDGRLLLRCPRADGDGQGAGRPHRLPQRSPGDGAPRDCPGEVARPEDGCGAGVVPHRFAGGPQGHAQDESPDSGCEIDRVVNHGIAFGCYFRDPEDNRVEVYWSTGVDYPQPYADPIDLSASEEALMKLIEDLPARSGTGPHYYGKDVGKRLPPEKAKA